MDSSSHDAAVLATVASTGQVFACDRRQTLLMAALQSGLNLPYECASGACGSCRCNLVEGEVASLWAGATGLSDRDRRRGNTILLCQSRPLSNVRIDVRVREPVQVPRPVSTQATIAAKRVLTHDMTHITLVPDELVRFLPGQFVIVEIPRLGRRAYSMANYSSGQSLELIVKAKPDGAVSGPLVRDLRVGDRLNVEGPYGAAYYRAEGDRPVVGIAGGSGLAPIWSIAQAAAAQARREIHLYFGVNSPRDMCFVEEMAALAAKGDRITTHLIVRESAPASVRAGLVGSAVIADLPSLTGSDVYMAGPPQMIDAVLGRLVAENRIESDRVFFDRFC